MAGQTPSSSSWETREEALCEGPTWAWRCDQGHKEGSRVGSQGRRERGQLELGETSQRRQQAGSPNRGRE